MKRKFVGDIFLNIAASMMPIGVLQLVVLPMLANDLGSEKYGLLITILSLFNLIPATLGNVLNNIRLLYNEEYKKSNYEGDYVVLFFMSEIISLVAVIGGYIYYVSDICLKDIVYACILSLLWLAREYYIVDFRLRINYKAIFANNFIMSIGHIFGAGIFIITGEWIYIFLLGYLFAVIYILLKVNILNEAIKITPMFYKISRQMIILTIATFLPRIITFADRLLIYPLLGGDVVSIYYTATILGNIISLVITPVANVILSYIAKEEKKNDNRFRTVSSVGLGICIVGYIGCIVISRPILNILYPQYVNEVMKYVPLTTGAVVIAAYTSLINPFLMKFCNMNWQIVINICAVVIYVVLGLFTLREASLYGFCLSVVFTNIFKLIISIIIYRKGNDIGFKSPSITP